MRLLFLLPELHSRGTIKCLQIFYAAIPGYSTFRDCAAGLIFAYPRKGPEFIEETRKAYRQMGGTFWKFELVDSLSLKELAEEMKRPQAYLASSPVEGCALPPQEAMAAGIVVDGRSAQGANFGMVHNFTAMVAETPSKAAKCLLKMEDPDLRERLAGNA
jgi:hypothetical protein